MKIAYLLTRSDSIGGASVHVRDCARAMMDRGHEVHVLVGGEGVFFDQLDEQGIPHEQVQYLKKGPPKPWSDLRAFFAIRKLLTEVGPDLVSCHSTKAGFLGRLAAASLAIPVLFTAHGWAFTEGKPWWKRLIYRTSEQLAAPLSTRIITVSRYDRRIALANNVGRPEKIVCIHNGMPDQNSVPRSRPGQCPPKLMMVARFEAQKDHATLLQALRRLTDATWALDLVGDGPGMDEIRTAAADAGLQHRVRFLGYREDVGELLADAHIFLLVSNWEGFPRSILEAMRAGLPVVASDVGGVSEAIVDGETGFTVPPNRPEPLANMLSELISDDGLRVRMGEAGRRRFEERFTFERMFERTYGLYREVVSKEEVFTAA